MISSAHFHYRFVDSWIPHCLPIHRSWKSLLEGGLCSLVRARLSKGIKMSMMNRACKGVEIGEALGRMYFVLGSGLGQAWFDDSGRIVKFGYRQDEQIFGLWSNYQGKMMWGFCRKLCHLEYHHFRPLVYSDRIFTKCSSTFPPPPVTITALNDGEFGRRNIQCIHIRR